MCTSIVSNRNKTIIGWNLDILDMEHKVVEENSRVYTAIYDKVKGWLPLFGANASGDFVTMPTCWPFDNRSDPVSADSINIINLISDLLLGKKTFQEIREIAINQDISSVPGVTFQSQLSDKEGNVLQITPGQGYNYIPKPEYSVMTNFSPFKGDTEEHPWMGLDRYNKAITMLEKANDNFDILDCFEVLKETAQTVCPTVVSMVFDATNNVVFWCEHKDWNHIKKKKLRRYSYSFR